MTTETGVLIDSGAQDWQIVQQDRDGLAELTRPLVGKATVVGAPTGCPPPIVPFDICGYRPMLGFTAEVTR